MNDLFQGQPALKTDHLPERPSWACKGCLHQWPCGTAQQVLLSHFSTQGGEIQYSLAAAYLAVQMSLAIPELPDASTHTLHHRFVDWLRFERLARVRREVGKQRPTGGAS